MSFRWDEKKGDETQSQTKKDFYFYSLLRLMSKKLFVTFSLSVALLSLFAAIEASLDCFWESSSIMLTVQICCSFNLVTVKSKKIIVWSYFFFFLLFTSTVFIISLYKSWFSTNENPCSKSRHRKPIIIPFKKILACDWMLIPYPCVFIELHCSFMWTGELGLNKSWFSSQSDSKTSKARVEEKRILYSFWSLLTGQNGVSQAVNSTVFHPAVERCQCRFILSLWYCTGSESRCW